MRRKIPKFALKISRIRSSFRFIQGGPSFLPSFLVLAKNKGKEKLTASAKKIWEEGTLNSFPFFDLFFRETVALLTPAAAAALREWEGCADRCLLFCQIFCGRGIHDSRVANSSRAPGFPIRQKGKKEIRIMGNDIFILSPPPRSPPPPISCQEERARLISIFLPPIVDMGNHTMRQNRVFSNEKDKSKTQNAKNCANFCRCVAVLRRRLALLLFLVAEE